MAGTSLGTGATAANPDTSISDSASLDLLCFSHLRWHFVTQRPQHLLSRCARDRRVFFWEEPIWEEAADCPAEGRLEVLEEGERLWVIRPHLRHGSDSDSLQRRLLSGFLRDRGVTRFVRWYYTPMALGFTAELDAEATVYDCMDELTGFLGAPPELRTREQELFAKADVVFTGGMSLYEVKRKQHANVHAFPSSIDVAHFSQATRITADPEDQAAIPHPRLGFFGVIDERFDIALMAEVARLRPEMHFCLLGPIVKIDPANLPRGENVHYLGGKNYSELPAYLAGWDAAILPFALNESTRYISPTKTPEYLAAGKPVVSTPIHDVISGYGAEGLVAIAATAEEFAAALDRALTPQSAEFKAAIACKLAQSSWDRTWAAMWSEIERTLPSRAETHVPAVSAFRTRSVLFEDGSRPARPIRQERFDYLVVGAGFAGSVLAERLATVMNKRVLVIDKRSHVAGNAFDFYNEAGILVHKYGPHIFHTNSQDVVDYLSKFTEWHQYEHRVLASVDGQLLPIPINLDTINRLYGRSLDAQGMQQFLADRAETPSAIRTSEDIVVSRVGRELYEKFFRNYTRKQWGLDPSELDASVAGRIPVRTDRDDRYFTDSFQAMPKKGFTRMFERMLDQRNLKVRTGVNYADVVKAYPGVKIIFTGPVDEYFDYRFGPLPYRSLNFKHETHAVEQFQPAAVINYPNDHAYTRVTEFKYLTGQRSMKTSVVYEYPQAEGDPYYPIPRPENAAVYAKYKELADAADRVSFAGRLACYKYFNMDQVVAQSLALFRRLLAAEAPSYILKESAATAASPALAELRPA